MCIVKVSVVIPVYNVSSYLEKCLASIVHQTLKEIEIIVVNDGSTDESGRIIEQFANRDNRIIAINKTNGGVSSARNAGLKVARGEYIIFIDSDDWIEPEYLKDMHAMAVAEKLDIVVADYYRALDCGKEVYCRSHFAEAKYPMDGKQYFSQYANKEYFSIVWNKLFSLNMLKKNQIDFPEDISLSEDLSTNLMIYFVAKRVGKIDNAYYHYIQRDNSVTKLIRGERQIKSFATIFDRAEVIYAKEPQLLYCLKCYQLGFFMHTYFWDYNIDPRKAISYAFLENGLRLNRNYKFVTDSKRLMQISWILKKLPYVPVVRLIRFIIRQKQYWERIWCRM